MFQHVSPLVALWWLGAVVAGVTLVLWVRQRRAAAMWRARAVRAEGAVRVRDAELEHLVSARLPDAVRTAGDPAAVVAGLREESLRDTAFAARLDGALRVVAGAVAEANAEADNAAKKAVSGAMRAIVSHTNEQQALISDMQERHEDPDVFEGLMGIDHSNAQLGRRAQAFAVLCGVWPGRTRSAASLEDVVRGAKSRIRDYRRVREFPCVEALVVARVVEPVVFALAELLDNAARYSPPDTQVEVRVITAHHGVSIHVDDYGVGMHAEVQARAEKLARGGQPVTMQSLGDPPQIGLAAVGMLAGRHGFAVTLTTSAYGGVRAVLNLSKALLATATNPDSAPSAVEPAQTAAGLPQRRRQARRAPAPIAEPAAAQQVEAASAAAFGAFQRGTNLGRARHPIDLIEQRRMTPQ